MEFDPEKQAVKGSVVKSLALFFTWLQSRYFHNIANQSTLMAQNYYIYY